MLWILTVFLVVALSNCDDSEWRQVRTSQGDVRGRKDPEGGLYVFYNIPYATVPLGADKFKVRFFCVFSSRINQSITIELFLY